MNKLIPPRFAIIGMAAAALTGCATVAEMDPQSDGALRRMSDQLAAAGQLSFSATRKMDRQLVDNPNMIGNAEISAQVNRPDRAKIVFRGDGNERRLHVGKDGSAIHSRNENLYARFPGKPTLDQSADAASKELGLHVPMQDFLSSNPYRDFSEGSDTIVHAGTETVRGKSCDHLKGKRDDLEWDLWISRSDHLPVRYAITVADLEGRNHLQLDFRNWNLSPSIAAGTFDFNPPKGSREIEFLKPNQ